MKKLKAGYGYYDVTSYPLGGCFRRAGKDGVIIVSVVRQHERCSGCNEQGLTDDNRQIAYDVCHTDEVTA